MYTTLTIAMAVAFFHAANSSDGATSTAGDERASADQASLRAELKASLKLAFERPISWTASARETCEDVGNDGKPIPKRPTDPPGPAAFQVQLVVSGQSAAMSPTNPSGMLLAAGVDATGGWNRTVDGLTQSITPSAAVLWNLPLLIPTISTMRLVGIPNESIWATVVKSHLEPDLDQFVIKSSNIRGGFVECAFRFRRFGSATALAGLDSAIYQLREGADPLKVVDITMEATDFVELGGSEVPTKLERKALLKDGTGAVQAHQVCRLQLSGVTETSTEVAMSQLAKLSAPQTGESVYVEARKLRFVIGEAWIEVAGVRMKLAAPIRSIPTPSELDELMKGADPEPRDSGAGKAK